MFSLLHISDLHRSKSDPVSNDELISSLVNDRARYTKETPSVRAPDAIVVSGDIIQGAQLGHAGFAEELDQQYNVAQEFLVELTERFLDGDRSKVVIAPGNHDVDWNTARQSMKAVDPPPADVRGLLSEPGTPYRWDWKELRLYRISDATLYEQRFASFWQFLERFYKGANGLLRLDRNEPANLWSLDAGRIGVAGFNSCDGNDCYALPGRINPSAIARADLDLKSRGPFDLHVAVWHHSFEGSPYATDYMSIDHVRSMIGRGFRLGLYGHHHRTQAAPYNVYLPARETMAVVSAGSLCAGRSELPPGFHRQYNVIEVGDMCTKARVHVRQMTEGGLFGRAALMSFGGISYTDLEWELPPDLVGRPIDRKQQRYRALISSAELAYNSGDLANCIQLLLPYEAALDDFGRQMLLDAAARSDQWTIVRESTRKPRSIEELVARTNASIKLRDYGDARSALAQHATSLKLDAATERDIRRRIAIAEQLHP